MASIMFSRKAIKARAAQRKGESSAELDRAEVGGALDFEDGVPLSGNPYSGAKGEAWAKGWHEAAREKGGHKWL